MSERSNQINKKEFLEIKKIIIEVKISNELKDKWKKVF